MENHPSENHHEQPPLEGIDWEAIIPRDLGEAKRHIFEPQPLSPSQIDFLFNPNFLGIPMAVGFAQLDNGEQANQTRTTHAPKNLDPRLTFQATSTPPQKDFETVVISRQGMAREGLKQLSLDRRLTAYDRVNMYMAGYLTGGGIVAAYDCVERIQDNNARITGFSVLSPLMGDLTTWGSFSLIGGQNLTDSLIDNVKLYRERHPYVDPMLVRFAAMQLGLVENAPDDQRTVFSHIDTVERNLRSDNMWGGVPQRQRIGFFAMQTFLNSRMDELSSLEDNENEQEILEFIDLMSEVINEQEAYYPEAAIWGHMRSQVVKGYTICEDYESISEELGRMYNDRRQVRQVYVESKPVDEAFATDMAFAAMPDALQALRIIVFADAHNEYVHQKVKLLIHDRSVPLEYASGVIEAYELSVRMGKNTLDAEDKEAIARIRHDLRVRHGRDNPLRIPLVGLVSGIARRSSETGFEARPAYSISEMHDPLKKSVEERAEVINDAEQTKDQSPRLKSYLIDFADSPSETVRLLTGDKFLIPKRPVSKRLLRFQQSQDPLD